MSANILVTRLIFSAARLRVRASKLKPKRFLESSIGREGVGSLSKLVGIKGLNVLLSAL